MVFGLKSVHSIQNQMVLVPAVRLFSHSHSPHDESNSHIMCARVLLGSLQRRCRCQSR